MGLKEAFDAVMAVLGLIFVLGMGGYVWGVFLWFFWEALHSKPSHTPGPSSTAGM